MTVKWVFLPEGTFAYFGKLCLLAQERYDWFKAVFEVLQRHSRRSNDISHCGIGSCSCMGTMRLGKSVAEVSFDHTDKIKSVNEEGACSDQ